MKKMFSFMQKNAFKITDDTAFRNWFALIAKTAAITIAVCLCAGSFSCRVTESGIIIVNDDFACPKIETYSVTSANSMRIFFSDSVNLKHCSLNPDIAVSAAESVDSASGLFSLDFLFDQPLKIGTEYRLYGVVHDKIGNSLTFSLPFTGFNDRIPLIELTEVHPKYASSKTKSGTVYKCEYVELRTKTAGNLAGLELYSAYDGTEKTYSFPAVEVNAGEVIVVHLRTKEVDGSISELGNDLILSTAKYSSDTARDLWAQNESARLGDETDIILLKNTADGSVLDAICYAPKESTTWKNADFEEAARLAYEYGAWNSADVADAVPSDGMTATKSLEKIASGKTATAWQLSPTSGETPGTVGF